MPPLSSFLVAGARVGVVGSRDFPCPSLVESFVVDFAPGVVVVSGAGGVVDRVAVEAAKLAGLPFEEFVAEWGRFGRPAGPLRNSRLVAGGLSCLCVFLSCPGAPSKGSSDVARKARAAGVPVFVFGPDGCEY